MFFLKMGNLATLWVDDKTFWEEMVVFGYLGATLNFLDICGRCANEAEHKNWSLQAPHTALQTDQ